MTWISCQKIDIYIARYIFFFLLYICNWSTLNKLIIIKVDVVRRKSYSKSSCRISLLNVKSGQNSWKDSCEKVHIYYYSRTAISRYTNSWNLHRCFSMIFTIPVVCRAKAPFSWSPAKQKCFSKFSKLTYCNCILTSSSLETGQANDFFFSISACFECCTSSIFFLKWMHNSWQISVVY